jgi:hypothetical protein
MPLAVDAGRSVDFEWVVVMGSLLNRYESDITLMSKLAIAALLKRASPPSSALHSPQIRET